MEIRPADSTPNWSRLVNHQPSPAFRQLPLYMLRINFNMRIWTWLDRLLGKIGWQVTINKAWYSGTWNIWSYRVTEILRPIFHFLFNADQTLTFLILTKITSSYFESRKKPKKNDEPKITRIILASFFVSAKRPNEYSVKYLQFLLFCHLISMQDPFKSCSRPINGIYLATPRFHSVTVILVGLASRKRGRQH